MVDELLVAQAQWLPQYADGIPAAAARLENPRVKTRAWDGAARRSVDRVIDRLVAGEFDDDTPPARIHGDLWGGNVLYRSDGGAMTDAVTAVLIDPAAHGGHALTDLAMLALFGTEHLDQVAPAYAEAAGVRPDWRDLIGLHQLHPLLVHAVTHGPGYGLQAGQVATRYT